MKVVILQSAETDLKNLKSYIVAKFGNGAWIASYAKIKESVAMIKSDPKVGRIPVELERLDIAQYRQLLSGFNRIIYEVREGTAYIHVFCDSRRDLQSLLMRRLVDPH